MFLLFTNFVLFFRPCFFLSRSPVYRRTPFCNYHDVSLPLLYFLSSLAFVLSIQCYYMYLITVNGEPFLFSLVWFLAFIVLFSFVTICTSECMSVDRIFPSLQLSISLYIQECNILFHVILFFHGAIFPCVYLHVSVYIPFSLPNSVCICFCLRYTKMERWN